MFARLVAIAVSLSLRRSITRKPERRRKPEQRMITPPLAANYQPQTHTIQLDGDLLGAAEAELRQHAETDVDKCFGYFPYMKSPGIDNQLPACKAVADSAPTLELSGIDLQFNFLRMSLVEQHASGPYHLDSDAATALTGDVHTVLKRQVWRLILNLSSKHTRTLGYLDANPAGLIKFRENYIYCPKESIPQGAIRDAVIPPRKDGTVHGVLFCSSQVLHTGKDNENGHFVGAYGR